MLRNNTYHMMYRSFDSDFEKDFFHPSYIESNRLDRASGYFTLNSLIISIEGLLQFIDNDGQIRLICNPELTPEDLTFIDAGFNLDKERITKNLIEIIDKYKINTSKEDIDALDIICNMIAENRLQIKIAFKKRGIYHEKLGIFYDEQGNRVYFNGSANQTHAALKDNFESFQVTCSWGNFESNALIDQEACYFQRIWDNSIKELDVINFPDAVKDNLFHQYKRSSTLQRAINKYKRKSIDIELPKVVKELYPYQKKAIDEFVNNNYCHFYEMATGTGKTFTAIKTIERLRRDIDTTLFTMILVPQIDLQTQWERALREEGFEHIYLMGGVAYNANDEYSKAVIEYYNDTDVVCICVYDTFFNKIYNQLDDDISNPFLIVDEAHNISSNQFKKLSSKIDYRLGLSATIKRFSEQETDKILSYFTDNLSEPFYYGIEEAIEHGFLSHYVYYPIYINLTEEEFKGYQKFTKNIAAEINKPEDERDTQKLDNYRRERSLIIKQATNKINKLEDLIKQNYPFKNSVVYCGQGKDKDSDEDLSIIDIVTKIIGNAGLKVSKFTSKTLDRKIVLEEFESGFYDTLIAIKCFDEGVDVPKLDKIYIMASEGALRQTVQRRGRVLRKCKETGKNMAFIYDMITLPPESVLSTDMGTSSLIKNEFRRVYEYNRLAENGMVNVKEFNRILDTYDLTEEDLNDDGITD